MMFRSGATAALCALALATCASAQTTAPEAVSAPKAVSAQPEVRLNDMATLPPPNEITGRTWAKNALVGQSFDGYAGYVLTVGNKTANGCDSTKMEFSALPYYKRDVNLPLTETAFTWYHSIIDKKASAEVKVFVFSGNLDAQDRAEVMVQDVGEQSVPAAVTDVDGLRKLAQQSLPPDACARYFVRKVILTVMSWRKFTKVSGGGNVSGLVFSVGGQAYSSTENFVNVPLLALDARDLASLPDKAIKGPVDLDQLPALQSPKLITITRGK